MSGPSMFSYAQRVAHKLSPCWTENSTAHADNNQSLSPQYCKQLKSNHYDLAAITDDSDNSSQTSSQTSSNDDGETNFSSPPTSVSSDGESVCEVRVAVNSQSLLRTASSTPNAQSASSQATSTQFQEIHNITLRPKTTQHHPESSSGCSTQTQSCTGVNQFGHQSADPIVTRFESRRRRCSVGGSTCPPKLKRDTDNTEAIVKMIVVFCTNLINSIWCPRAFDDPTSTTMGGAGVLPLQIFITETLRRSKTSYSTLQIALYYLILLKQCLPCAQGAQSGQSGCRAMQCGRRMFLTALILASKYLQDRNYSARAWSKISGLPLKEINENERRYLGMISWDLHVPKETFENWSKIVLAICRLSSDADIPGRDFDHRPPGPSTGLASFKQTQLQSMCADTSASKNWWLNNLRCLSLGMVRCSRKTEDFLSTISPFRPISSLSPQFFFDPLPRVYSPDTSLEKESETEATPKCLPRLPSMERIGQSFQTLERAGSPAVPYKMPPQPVLRNLPTPQTTPRPDATSIWSGFYKPNLRCRASASALGNLDKTILPTANLESCPPPKPRTCDRSRGSTLSSWTNNYTSWQMSREPTPSLTSSPESVVSDVSSVTARSRSSSISSTSSWLPTVTSTPVQENDSRFRRDVMSLQQKLAAERIPTHVRRVKPAHARPGLSRCQTALRLSSQEEEASVNDRMALPRIRHSQSMRFADDGYGSEDLEFPDKESNRKTEAAEALLAFHSRSSTPSQISELNRNRSVSSLNDQIIERRSSQYLKRARSDSSNLLELDTKLALLNGQQTWQVAQDPWLSQFAESEDNIKAEREKQTQLPCQVWATPRKPIQCGAQNKRMAMQTPQPAPNVAANYLRQELMVG